MDRLAVGGILVVDKPAGRTSAHVVATVKKRLRADRVGHTGTLDPLATGVLPIVIGEATKLAGFLIEKEKAYEAELELGAATDTQDSTGTITHEDRAAAAALTTDAIRAALPPFTGAFSQVPPMYSAVKIGRRRLYHMARAGETVERAPRAVEVTRLDLLAHDGARVRLAIECSKGFFVRTLADDLGRALGCGAHLTALCRTRSGPFHLADALPLDLVHRDVPLLRAADTLSLPRLEVPGTLRICVTNAHAEPLAELCANRPESERFQMVSERGDLLALCHMEAGRVLFDRVFRAP